MIPPLLERVECWAKGAPGGGELVRKGKRDFVSASTGVRTAQPKAAAVGWVHRYSMNNRLMYLPPK